MAIYARNLTPTTLDHNESNNNCELTIEEKRQLRAQLGVLQWPSSQACLRVPASVRIHRGQLPTARVGADTAVSKALRFYVQNAD
eukprot:4026731-Pyramimonas_sp.AAC.1